MSPSLGPYPPLASYLIARDAARAIDFYKAAFGATERYRLASPETGKVGHAELDVNGGMIMLADEHPGYGQSPAALGGTPVKFCLMVENADAAIERAVAAGATVLMPAADTFYGFRSGCVRDPFGHEWMLQHEIKKMTPEELQSRWSGMCSGSASTETPAA